MLLDVTAELKLHAIDFLLDFALVCESLTDMKLSKIIVGFVEGFNSIDNASIVALDVSIESQQCLCVDFLFLLSHLVELLVHRHKRCCFEIINDV